MEEEEIGVKYDKVKHWLQSFDESDVIPQFEVNDETINFLHRMCEHNIEMNELSTLLHRDVNTKYNEYQIETARMKEMLEGVGLPIHALSHAGKSSLKTLSQLASVLDIKDVNKSSFMLALHDMSGTISDVMEEVSKKKDDTNNQISQATFVLKNLEDVAFYYQKLAEHSAVDIPLTEKRKKDIEKMKSKMNSYKKQLSEDENNINLNNIEKHLHHTALVRLSNELKSLQEELKPLQCRYQSYVSVPPDIQLLKVKIEETRRYMDELEKELQTDIDYLTL